MSSYNSEKAAEIRASCEAGVSAAGQAIERALGIALQLSVGDCETCDPGGLSEKLTGKGLAFAFTLGEGSALAFLPDDPPWLPDWCAQPDEAQREQLAQLASELGQALLPESLGLAQSEAHVGDMAALLERAATPDEMGLVSINLSGEEKQARLLLIWPIDNLSEALAEPAPQHDTSSAGMDEPQEEKEKDESHATQAAEQIEESAETEQPLGHDFSPAAAAAGPLPRNHRLIYGDLDDGIAQLPPYARSLLKIRVPITVTLAQTKLPLSQITDLSPGAIIQFKKSCDDSLALEIGDQVIAEGEAVKVGDKFGLWITTMMLPDERFWVVHGLRTNLRVK